MSAPSPKLLIQSHLVCYPFFYLARQPHFLIQSLVVTDMRQPQLRRASHLVRQLYYGRLPEDGHPPPNNENDLYNEDNPPKKDDL